MRDRRGLLSAPRARNAYALGVVMYIYMYKYRAKGSGDEVDGLEPDIDSLPTLTPSHHRPPQNPHVLFH